MAISIIKCERSGWTEEAVTAKIRGKSKWFSVKKYGLQEALDMARAFVDVEMLKLSLTGDPLRHKSKIGKTGVPGLSLCVSRDNSVCALICYTDKDGTPRTSTRSLDRNTASAVIDIFIKLRTKNGHQLTHSKKFMVNRLISAASERRQSLKSVCTHST